MIAPFVRMRGRFLVAYQEFVRWRNPKVWASDKRYDFASNAQTVYYAKGASNSLMPEDLANLCCLKGGNVLSYGWAALVSKPTQHKPAVHGPRAGLYN